MRFQAKTKLQSVSLPAWTASGTAQFAIFALPDHFLRVKPNRLILKKISYVTGTVPVFGTTGLINIFKKSIGVAAVQLVTSFSLAAGVTANEALAIPFDATVTIQNRILAGQDSLYGTLVAGSTVTTPAPAFAHGLGVEFQFIDIQGDPFMDADGDLAG